MNKRELYLSDRAGKVIRRWPVAGWNETSVSDLERRIRAIGGPDLNLRDTAFDRQFGQDAR